MDGVARGEISRKFATLWLVARSRAFRCFFFHARRVLLGSSATVDGFDFRAMDRVVMCSDARREATAQPVCRLAQGTQARLKISFRLSLLAFVRPPHFPVARSSPLSAGLSLSSSWRRTYTFRRISVDPLGMAEADITSVVPCGSVQFRPV